MEGLEAVEISLSEAAKEDSGYRWDSEFYRKPILFAKAMVEQCPHKTLADVTPWIQHPVEVERRYAEQGIRVLLAQEVRSNLLSLGDGSFMDEASEQSIRANKLVIGDVVLTRTGANFGQCAPVLTDDVLYACADLLILRKGNFPAGYVSTFLNTAQGRLLLDRGAYGMAQPHIAPTYVRTIPIPIFRQLIDPISQLLDFVTACKEKSLRYFIGAEKTLLRVLGLENWQAPESLSYVRNSREAFAAGRLDAEFFTPHVRDLLDMFGRDGLTIADVAPPRHERFIPEDNGTFDYIEIGSVRNDGTAEADAVPQREAPSRATQKVRAGDVITSTVRPIRRLSAMIGLEQDGYVCSSGFVVLQPRKIAPEVLLTYLRLKPVCELMDLHTSASLYPAISERDLLSLPIPIIPKQAQHDIELAVSAARQSKQRATQLLDAAKRAVEIAIEDSETAALAYLAEANP